MNASRARFENAAADCFRRAFQEFDLQFSLNTVASNILKFKNANLQRYSVLEISASSSSTFHLPAGANSLA